MVSSRGVLPTRKNRAAKEDAAVTQGLTADGKGSSIESRQMSRAGDRQSRGGEEARMDYNNNNTSTSTNDATKQSFVMDDIPTIDTSTMPPAYDRNPPSRRGASPSIITSRRGRSRSPVGYNNNPSGAAAASRPSSRNGSSGRPLSRNDISSAAFAAGEAAAGVMDPYARQQSHHPQLMHARARSPSPVNRFPTLAMSFEVSPQQSMSFMGDGCSFDWNAGSQQHAAAVGRRSPSPPQQQQHYNYGRSSSPLQASRTSRNSQALFPEHQILSSRSREYFGTQGGNSSNNNRGERRTIRSPSPNPNRSSVFRGSPSQGSAANRLPAELMLALDDTPPSSPVAPKQKKAMDKKSNQSNTTMASSNAAAAAAAATIDKELSATQDVAFENIQFDGIMPEGDYLANLSLRKSYDLEQVFSFMNENKEDKSSRDPMKLGNSSFANFASTLMCNSNEVGDRTKPQHPVIQSIASQNSNMGLTPIHSFNDAQVDQVDGVELGRFLQNAPIMQDDGPTEAGGQYWSYNQSSAPAAMHTQTPPSYNNVYTDEPNVNKYAPSSGPAPAIPTLGHSSLATSTQVKVSTRHTVQPTINLSSKSDFFALLRKMAPAFMGFRFTLPEMSEPAPEPKEDIKSVSLYRPTEGQMVIARRRVNSSVCAFGGVIAHRVVSFDTSREDIKVEVEEKRKYDENLSMRYFMKENCVSWDVELHDVIKPSAKKAKTGESSKKVPAAPKSTVTKNNPLASPYCAPVTPKSPGQAGDNNNNSSNNNNNKDGEKKGKTKYRCKLCGLPKQNHTCTYKSKVVRSIGTQVYPVVNAFVSNEPGLLAPALSEMNNFTSMLSQDTSTAPASHVYRMPYNGYNGPITPDSHWSPTTPGGLSTMSSCDPGTPRTPNSPYSNNFRKRDYSVMSRTMTHTSTPGGYSPRSKPPQDSMFRDTMEIKMEQFRTVRVNAAEKVLQPYQYPLVPTPYDQRKEMGDTLFALSKEVPSLADSCASILREARERDEWDQAVAELTTQVLVVLKCEEEDYNLEGLMRHLNGLGIAC